MAQKINSDNIIRSNEEITLDYSSKENYETIPFDLEPDLIAKLESQGIDLMTKEGLIKFYEFMGNVLLNQIDKFDLSDEDKLKYKNDIKKVMYK